MYINQSKSLLLILTFIAVSCTPNKKDYLPDISITSSPKGTNVFKSDSASIASNYRVPIWFRDAKFGIFVHWGVYSVPAYESEWYPYNMYKKNSEAYKHHLKTYGELTEFGYKDFIPMFKAENFNADEWLSLFEKAGVQYVIPVAEHHDGFAMYESTFNRWKSTKMGPRRDIIAELKQATIEHGLHFGLSSHRAENAFYYYWGTQVPSDVQDLKYNDLYGQKLYGPNEHPTNCPEGDCSNAESQEQWLKHTYELIDLYQPELFWFDWTVGKNTFRPTFYKFMAYYYNNAIDWDKEVVINTKFGFGDNIQVHDIERGKSEKPRKFPWQTDTSIGKKSWGYISNEENKTPNQIIDDLVDIVSKNGNLLLNIGPKPDGTISNEQRDVLLDIGKWLNVNGEAIYETRPWKIAMEGNSKGTSGSNTDNMESEYTPQDIRFTTKGNILYATSLAWSEHRIIIKSINNSLKVSHISMLGTNKNIKWSQEKNGLKIQFPKEKPCEYAYVFKITLEQNM